MTHSSRVHPNPGSPIPNSPDAAEGLLRSLLFAVEPVVIRLDAQFRIRYISRLEPGFELEQVIGQPSAAFIEPRDVPVVTACWEAALRGEPGHYRTESAPETGSGRSYETWVGPYDGPEGRGIVMMAIEVPPFRAQERELLQSQASLQMAQHATGMGLWSWDLPSNRVHWNAQMESICGQTHALNFSDFIEQLVHPEDREKLRVSSQSVLDQPHFSSPPYRIVRADGTIRHLRTLGTMLRDSSGQIFGIVGGTLDITAEHEREERARQRERLASIGQLTAGMAHNFNNLLATIIPTLELLAPTAPPRMRLLAEDAMRSAVRAAEIIRQLGHYARQDEQDVGSTTPLLEPVGRAVRLCERLFDPAVQLVQELDSPSLHVPVADAELEQALVNLLLNARDALEGSPSPCIRVQATRAHPPAELGWSPADAALGAICIAVSDNGPGMTEDVRRRVFEPFFTTKESGRGTGMGLATVEATLRRVGGAVRCLSSPGQGTRFELWFSATSAPEDVATPPALPIRGDGESVLVVDDEHGILRTMSLLLQNAGYRVLTAASCGEAMAQARVHPNIAAIVMDRWLPDGNGAELVGPLRAELPGVTVLLHSGNFVPPEERRRVDAVLEKPVPPGRLLEVLSRTLRPARPAP